MMEDIDGGLHPAVDGQSLDDDDDDIKACPLSNEAGYIKYLYLLYL